MTQRKKRFFIILRKYIFTKEESILLLVIVTIAFLFYFYKINTDKGIEKEVFPPLAYEHFIDACMIDINEADFKTLKSLKGIGETKANAIIQYRELGGDFVSVEDLENVKGIGPKIVALLKKYVKV